MSEKVLKKSGKVREWGDRVRYVPSMSAEIMNLYDEWVGPSAPTIYDIVILLGVSKSTIYRWASEHAPFKAALEYCADVSARYLIKNGLENKSNASMSKFVLQNLNGFKEESNISGTLTLSDLLSNSYKEAKDDSTTEEDMD